jgi:DNA invertase Pin-like site-specific DNA recombinase
MPVAVPYVRFSDPSQQHGSSRERQEALVSGWLARNPKYTRYERKFEDLGLSGYHGHHVTEGEMGRLLDAVEQGFIPAGSVVLVEALDRFSRLKPMATLRNLETLVSRGVSLITLEDGQQYDASALDDQRLLFLAMKAQAAHEYSARLSARVLGSFVERTKAAKAGEKIKRRNPFWLTSEGELIPDKARALHEAFLAFSNGVPLRLLANQHREHFANRQSLKHALKNPAAIGHWQRFRFDRVDGKQVRTPGELIKNVFEPAVPEELFFQVQQMLATQAEQAPTVARKFPLAGLLECAHCGANMVLLRANNRNATDAVRCSKRMAGNANCDNQRTLPVPVVGWFFYETMRPFAFRAYQRTKLPEAQRQRIKLEGQIDQLRQQQARLRKLVMMDDDDTDAQAEYQALVDQYRALKAELDALPSVDDVAQVPMQEFYRFLNGDPFATSNLLQQDGYRVLCHQDGTLAINQEGSLSARYIGYRRKLGRWAIELDGSEIIEVDRYANTGAR